EAEVRRPARDSELQRSRLEHCRPPAVRPVPRGDHVGDPLAHDRGLERATVEQEPVGTDEGDVGRAGRRPLAVQELRQLPRPRPSAGAAVSPLRPATQPPPAPPPAARPRAPAAGPTREKNQARRLSPPPPRGGPPGPPPPMPARPPPATATRPSPTAGSPSI